MLADRIPESEQLALSSERAILARALEQISGGKPYTHVEVIFGAPRSGRILLLKACGGAIRASRPYFAEDAAGEVLKLTEARYHPSSSPAAVKG